MMHIFVSYPIIDKPFGGGNQFLKGLAGVFESRGLLTQDLERASVVLTNSFFYPPLETAYDRLFAFKRAHPNVRFLHRMDGVLHVYRGNPETAWQDEISALWAQICTDGVIFQSEYCRDLQYEYGYPQDIPATIVGNASDRNIFYPPAEKRPSPDGRIRLIYTSWSSNMLKGFPTLQMLDDSLDFNRYSFTFVGNSPVEFKNIRHFPAQPSTRLAELLREADIFVGLSHNEPCSNAICEALTCGLPVLIRNTGGNPSYVPCGAILYDSDEDVLPSLERMAPHLHEYRARLRAPDMEAVADQYLAFAERLMAEAPQRRPDCRKFLALRHKLRDHYPQLPERRAWRCKLWLEGLWN